MEHLIVPPPHANKPVHLTPKDGAFYEF